jgi:hypothetical protein
VQWRSIRAGLVAVAIGFGLIDGLPLPSKPLPWQRDVVDAVRPIQRTLEWPVRWLKPALQIGQQWTLFQAAPRDRYRMWIEARDAAGRWTPTYRADDPDHDEDAALLHYRRVRVAWDPSDEPATNYSGFCAWITARVLAHHDGATAARVRMEQIVLDGGEATTTGAFVLACERAR